MGIRALLMKPFNLSALAINIRRVLDQGEGSKRRRSNATGHAARRLSGRRI